ncbi:ferritin-like protein [Streptomyces rubrisoli]|uniref:Ferritin-like protein n=2 Tax=Streptantibioticus rubrisoli TaxID=1387313 RepID=A0ABT1P7K3_9ACTN|nr:ferritin-like protein [Streptantibioticus rubrisoli]
MSTIPMYLYASFSIASRGYSQWDPGMGAFRLIRSIVVEEMLHLSLVSNLLVALGDEDIRFYDEDFVPRYPSRMLHRHPELVLHLEPCGKEVVRDVFMEFERPEPKKGEGRPPKGQYATIGEFYRAVGKGLEALDKKMGPALWKHNRLAVQYTGAYWNHDGGGDTVLVRDLKSAQNALKIIIEQGGSCPLTRRPRCTSTTPLPGAPTPCSTRCTATYFTCWTSCTARRGTRCSTARRTTGTGWSVRSSRRCRACW